MESLQNMNPDDFVIFAELNRDHFDEIVLALSEHFENIEHGSQGDDWIWIHLGEDRIEIDSFYSMNLEFKGRYEHLSLIRKLLQTMSDAWILQVFDPPKMDMTR